MSRGVHKQAKGKERDACRDPLGFPFHVLITPTMRFALSLSLLVLPLLAAASPPAVYGAASRSLRRAAFPNPLLSPRQAACTSQCSSASDTAAIENLANCVSSNLPCVCAAIESVSSTCLDCVLSAEGLTASELAAACGGTAGTGGAATSVAGGTSSASASPTGTASGGSTDGCDTECASASDQTGLNTLTACAGTDTACICTASYTLSTTCLDCTLSLADVTPTEWAQSCGSASGASGAGSAGGSISTSSGSGFGFSSSSASSTSSVVLGGGAPTTAGNLKPTTTSASSSSSTTPATSPTTTTHSGAGQVAVGGLLGMLGLGMALLA
ncbi:hypothetical protein CALVIDRAFT_91296 [Calocera viscosa TUFC12733]|uniref:Uncharacterized protein n=1 Tax=Calocera viscosa (strain TUFC12733) TaxID=1330018 RepID=A0A167MTV3_CALVF|nr:hypothetical protein CALVIDRAFT_91296 [Calocera viscosa TUFC12733]